MARLLRVLVLVACVSATLSRHDSSRPHDLNIDETGVALVASSGQLQTAFSPKVLPSIDSVSIINDIFLDPLALVPTLRVNRSLSLCGAAPDVVLTAKAPLQVATVNSSVTFCNVTIDLAFPVNGSVESVGSALVGFTPFASIFYRDVTFAVRNDTFAQLEVNLPDTAAASVDGVDTLRNVSGTALADSGASFHFENVTVVAPGAPRFAVAGPSFVTNAEELSVLTLAATRGSAPVVVEISGNFTLTQCLLDKVNDGKPIDVLRPLTLKAAKGGAWLTFGPGLTQNGFFRVQNQLRLVDINLSGDNESGPEDISFDMKAAPRSVMYDSNSRGCRVVGVNTLWVKPCEVVNGFARLALLRTSAVDLIDMIPVDSKTVRLDRYVSQGECFQNTLITCREGIVVEGSQAAVCKGS